MRQFDQGAHLFSINSASSKAFALSNLLSLRFLGCSGHLCLFMVGVSKIQAQKNRLVAGFISSETAD